MKEKFIEKEFDAEATKTIQWLSGAIGEYASKGYQVSVRQLFYYGVARNFYPNTEASYKKLVGLVTDARMAGWLDWAAIVDRNRATSRPYYFANPESCFQNAIESFKIDKWARQPCYIEVLVEKAALEGVIEPVCSRYDVPFTSLRGYGSATLMYDVGKRLHERFVVGGKQLHIFALADHDPSGQDITRDLANRLSLFSNCPVNVHRLALNMDQVGKFNLPENPAKITDPRANGYIKKFGDSSWELDAIPVETLAEWVTGAIDMLRNKSIWDADVEREDQIREEMQDLIS